MTRVGVDGDDLRLYRGAVFKEHDAFQSGLGGAERAVRRAGEIVGENEHRIGSYGHHASPGFGVALTRRATHAVTSGTRIAVTTTQAATMIVADFAASA